MWTDRRMGINQFYFFLSSSSRSCAHARGQSKFRNNRSLSNCRSAPRARKCSSNIFGKRINVRKINVVPRRHLLFPRKCVPPLKQFPLLLFQTHSRSTLHLSFSLSFSCVFHLVSEDLLGFRNLYVFFFFFSYQLYPASSFLFHTQTHALTAKCYYRTQAATLYRKAAFVHACKHGSFFFIRKSGGKREDKYLHFHAQ